MTDKPEGGRDSQATAYNFECPNRLSSEQIKRMEYIHTTVAKRLSVSLSGMLRDYVEVEVTSVSEIPWLQFFQSIPQLCVTFTFAAEPLQGTGIISVEPPLAFALVDRLFGGKGEAIDVQRELTPIEQKATGKIVAATLREIQIAWKPFVDAKIAVSGFASSPDFIHGPGASESVVVVSLSIRRSDSSGDVNVVYPHLMFEPAMRKLVNPTLPMGVRQTDQERVTRLIQSVRVPVAARLRPSMISVDDLSRLQVGDVLMLDNHVSEDVAVFVGDKRVLKGRPGELSGRIAIKIVRSLSGGGK
jgi:flagellar motor switch protein FliM